MLKYFFLSKKNQEFLTLLKKHKGLHKNYYRFYRNQKGKLSKSLVNYLFPERHFVVKGQYFARKPFATYDPFDYFNYMFLSQDLAESSYQSYLRHKHINAADINTKAGKLYNKLKEIDEKYQNIDFKIKENKQDIAIVLHLYHLELLDELLAYINKIEMDFDLYITIGDHASPLQREEINSKIKNKQADAFIAYVPNHGRDIFPLLQLINNNLLNDYKAILKLHSKKKLHDLEKGEKNRIALINAIIPPNFSHKDITTFINDNDSAIVVAKDFLLNKKYWFLNKKHTFYFLNKLNLTMAEDDLLFPAESIYWMKSNIIAELKRLQLTAYDFPAEAAKNDGETAHAVERLIGAIAVSKNLQQIEV